MSTESIVFNGINGATGGYLLEMTPEEITKVAKGETQRVDGDHADELEDRAGKGKIHYQLSKDDLDALLQEDAIPKELSDKLRFYSVKKFDQKPQFLEHLSKVLGVEQVDQFQALLLKRGEKRHKGLVAGLDPNKLDQAGWGVIFARDADPAIRDALKELLDLRREQAGKYYKDYSGEDGYDAANRESKRAFLTRHGAGPGPADPAKVPYYLLIVGDPETIPYQFQYQLDVQYAVGRIHFDTIADYKHYARSVVDAEKRGGFLPRQAAFFGVQNPDDGATGLSTEHLVKPLSKYIAKDQPDWAIQTFLAEEAHKAQLGRLLGGDQTPAFLFTASHGMGFPKDDPRQFSDQGALLCQDWRGPKAHQGPISPEVYFSAEDVKTDAGLFGLIAFHFACFGAGTPRLDDFAHHTSGRAAIAPHAFVANLPRRLLSHPAGGGALAVVGHVERAWGYSFIWNGAGAQLGVFQSTLKLLFEGYTLGAALEYFNQRYAELSTELTPVLDDLKAGKRLKDPAEFAGMWTATNDARSYVIIGDPAVRLPVGKHTMMTTSRPQSDSTITVQSEAAPSEAASSEAANFAAEASDASTASSEISPENLNAAMNFGLFEPVDKTKAKLTSALQQFSEKLSQTLAKAVDDVTALEVATYASGDMSGVAYDFQKGEFSGANLRAVTRISLDGDTKVCVPEKDGKVDDALWAIHCEMIKQAQAQRSELLKTLVSTATGVINILKGL